MPKGYLIHPFADAFGSFFHHPILMALYPWTGAAGQLEWVVYGWSSSFIPITILGFEERIPLSVKKARTTVGVDGVALEWAPSASRRKVTSDEGGP